MRSMITDCGPYIKKALQKLIQRTDLIHTVHDYPTLSEGLRSEQNTPPNIVFTELEPKSPCWPHEVWPENAVSTVIISDTPSSNLHKPFVHLLCPPLRFKPFNEIVNQAYAFYKSTLNTSANDIFITSGNRTYRFIPEQVLYMEAQADYVTVVCIESKQLLHITMKKLEEIFEQAGFIRVHRSYIVNPDKITQSTHNALYLDQIIIPIGRSYKKKFWLRYSKLKAAY